MKLLAEVKTCFDERFCDEQEGAERSEVGRHPLLRVKTVNQEVQESRGGNVK